MELSQLQAQARCIRRDIVEMNFRAQSGHMGGSLSIVEVLTALYFSEMRVDPQKPDAQDRDRFILSKGHTAPALYATLANAGFFPRERLLDSFRCINGNLQGHPDMCKTPGVDMTSGSLGMGLSAGCGMALAGRFLGLDFDTYCLMGDGEINEGQIWEAAASAAHFRLDRLIGLVDLNGLQNDGCTKDVKNMGSMGEKWKAFGWHVQEVDGHNLAAILAAIHAAKEHTGSPSVLLLHTVKGKGISFMEDQVLWHGKTMNQNEYRQAMKELQ